MYEIKLINGSEETVIHYPSANSEAPHLTEAKIKKVINQIDYLKFPILINNPGFDKLTEMKTLVNVIDTRDNSQIYTGRVLLAPKGMDSSGKFYRNVVVENELGYLNDSNAGKWEGTLSIRDFLTMVINNHNSRVEASKHFQVGDIQLSGNVYAVLDYQRTINVIADKLINKFGGELRIRKENGVRYLDYLTQIGQLNSTEIRLGKNMKDMEIERDPTAVITRLIPIGKEGLTISSVNNGKNYVENVAAIAEFGILEDVFKFDDITDANTLKTAGQEKLDNVLCKIPRKLKISAYDLSLIGIDAESFGLGDDVPIVNTVLSVNENFRIIEQEIDLISPQNSTLIFDNKFDTLTQRQINMQLTSEKINKMLTEGGLNTNYLQGAIDLLKNSMHAMADAAEKQKEVAILFEDTITDSPTYGAMALGTKGFMIADTKVNGVWDWKTFGTGKGFVADLIVAGHILGGNMEINLDEAYIKMMHSDGTYTLLDSDTFKRDNNPYKFMRYQVIRPAIQNGTIETIVLPQEFQGKAINTDFSVYAWAGAIDSDAFSTFKVDAIRNVFIQVVSWDSNTRELKVKPCLQKIGLDTHTYFGWDANTTTEGNPIGEGKIDIYVFIDM